MVSKMVAQQCKKSMHLSAFLWWCMSLDLIVGQVKKQATSRSTHLGNKRIFFSDPQPFGGGGGKFPKQSPLLMYLLHCMHLHIQVYQMECYAIISSHWPQQKARAQVMACGSCLVHSLRCGLGTRFILLVRNNSNSASVNRHYEGYHYIVVQGKEQFGQTNFDVFLTAIFPIFDYVIQ